MTHQHELPYSSERQDRPTTIHPQTNFRPQAMPGMNRNHATAHSKAHFQNAASRGFDHGAHFHNAASHGFHHGAHFHNAASHGFHHGAHFHNAASHGFHHGAHFHNIKPR